MGSFFLVSHKRRRRDIFSDNNKKTKTEVSLAFLSLFFITVGAMVFRKDKWVYR